jgi:hypothetical protein
VYLIGKINIKKFSNNYGNTYNNNKINSLLVIMIQIMWILKQQSVLIVKSGGHPGVRRG